MVDRSKEVRPYPVVQRGFLKVNQVLLDLQDQRGLKALLDLQAMDFQDLREDLAHLAHLAYLELGNLDYRDCRAGLEQMVNLDCKAKWAPVVTWDQLDNKAHKAHQDRRDYQE